MSTGAAYNALAVSNTLTFPHGDNIHASVSPNVGALFFEDNTDILYVGTRTGWFPINGGGGTNYTSLPPIPPTDNNAIVIDNGANTIKLEFADGTHNGIVSTVTQSYAGDKTFNDNVNVLGNFDMVNSTVTDGVFTKAGTRFLHNFGITNTFLGLGSGNFTTSGTVLIGIGNNVLASNTSGDFLIAVGDQSMAANTTGSNSYAFGHGALSNNTTGSDNCAFGDFTLASNTTGNDNCGFGDGALTANLTGFQNCAYGISSLFKNTTGSFNSAYGAFSLQNNTTGGSNTGFGFGALIDCVTGIFNVGVGVNATTTGSNCTMIGYSAGFEGSSNTAVGYRSQGANLADNTTSIGFQSLLHNLTGIQNTALGYQSCRQNTTGNNNCSGGFNSLILNSTGSNNTCYGSTTLSSLTSGSNNICIGFGAGNGYTGAESGNILIGSAGAPAESNVIRIGTGQTTNFQSGIRGVITSVNDAIPVLIDSNGQLGTVSSSMTKKEDIKPMKDVKDIIAKLVPSTFYMKEDLSKKLTYGFIAEHLKTIIPEIVVTVNPNDPEEEQWETIQYEKLMMFAIKEIQRLQIAVDELQSKIK